MFKKCLFISCILFSALIQLAFSNELKNDDLILYNDILYIPVNADSMDALGLTFSAGLNNEVSIKKTYGQSKNNKIALPIFSPIILGELFIPIAIENARIDVDLETPALLFSRGHLYMPLTTSWVWNFLEIAVGPDLEIKNHLDPSIPSYYNTYDVLPQNQFIRDQGSANTCWAFAAHSMFELYVAIHFNEFMTFSVDHILENVPIPTTPYSGGYFQGASAYYLAHMGPIDEERREDTFVLRSYVTYSHMNDVKKHIKDNGAVLTAIYYDPDRSDVFNEKTSSYFNPSLNNPKTHDILLIGWDDAYPKEHFHTKPHNNGAFIAQNSFGTHWGEEGLFYISYEDVQVLTTVHGYDKIDKIQNEEFLYYHNDKGVTHFEGFPGKKNVIGFSKFTSLPFENEYLTGVGIYTNAENLNVSVFIGQNMSLESEEPIKHVLYEGIISKIGYHYIQLETPVFLKQNADFYIGANYQGRDSFLFPIQAPYPGIDYEILGVPGRSYLGYEDPEFVFYDMYALRQNGSVAIRGYSRQK